MRKLFTTILAAFAFATSLSAQDDIEFWGVVKSHGWASDLSYGLYSFKVGDEITHTGLFTGDDYLWRSGAWQDGIYYGIDYSEAGWISPESGSIIKVNTSTWQQEGDAVSLNLPDQRNFVPVETARALDGTIYGEFLTATTGQYEIGTVDYANMQRTTIATTSKYYLALAISRNNTLYGIEKDGNLYKISTTDGSATLVGSTGVTIGGPYTSPEDYPCSGEIDPSSDIFYWAYYSGVYGQVPTLYSVDLNTGKATKVKEFSDEEQIVGMTFPVQSATDGVPAAPADLQAHFENGSLTGSVSFLVPDTANTGEKLTSQVSYEISLGSQKITGEAAPGAQVSENVTAEKGGQTTVRVQLSNAKGKGLSSSTSLWIGYDYPAAPTDVKALLHDGNKVAVSWTAPSAGINNGFLGQLTYNVYRVSGSDTTRVAEKTAETSMTDILTLGENTLYKYLVEAVNDTLVGSKGESASFVAGKAYSVPFTDEFDANTKRDYYTTIDANHDGITVKRHYTEEQWGGMIPAVDYEEMMYDGSGASQNADDWFITPKIHLEAGKVYSFSLDARCAYGTEKHTFEVKLGTSPKAESMTDIIIPVKNIQTEDAQNCLGEFTVSQDGDYNIGIHILSAPVEEAFYFDNIVVKVAADPEAPAMVGDLKVTPDATGLPQATVSYTAPIKTISGNDLSTISKVEISRNDHVIATQTDVTPGKKMEYTDTDVPNGFNNYMIVVYNDKGNGLRAHKDSVYVGVDVPLAPQGVAVADNDTSLTFTWLPVADRGQNGRVVRPQDVMYSISSLNSSYEPENLIADELSDTAYTVASDENEGEQDIRRWGIRAYNAAGYSPFAYVRTIIGAPYNLPYRESFATGVGHGLNWMEGPGNFNIATDDAADADAGCISYQPTVDGETTSFNLGKISMLDADNPVLTFFYKGLSSKDSINVNIAEPDGRVSTVATLKGAADKWTKATVKLHDFAGKRYIVPKFAVTGSEGETIRLDGFDIEDVLAYDLGVELDAPASAIVNTDATVSVKVTNYGSESVSDYQILMKADGKQLEPVVPDKAILPGETQTFMVSVPVKGEGNSVMVEAQIDFFDDLNTDNDIATALIQIDRTTGIMSAETTGAKPEDIYTLGGQLVGHKAATSLRGIRKGVYVVRGKKVVVK